MIDSKGRYIINRKGAPIVLAIVFCVAFLPLFFAPPGPIGDTILAYICAALFFTLFYLLFYHTYAFFDGDVFHMIKMLVLRDKIPVTNISSLKRKHTFAGAFSGIEVTYKNDSGRIKRAMVPISALGTKNVAAILHKFLEINPTIKTDSSAQELMRKF
jgi:hypothetical protein